MKTASQPIRALSISFILTANFICVSKQPFSPYVLGKPHPNPPKADEVVAKKKPVSTQGSGEAHSAAAFGNVEFLKKLIADGTGVHLSKDANDWQPVHEGV
jgi:hypothetical protein